MPHERARSATSWTQKLAALWPVVGVVGPRQVGKTTLLLKLLQIPHSISLDDLEAREEALHSPKAFLAKLQPPVAIDEIQKAPPLFDAIKYKVDQKRIPGSFFLTGSSAFSAKIGIRESLTGRIGLLPLHPMSLTELHQKEFLPLKDLSKPLETPRFDIESATQAMVSGGMPLPAFFRSADQRHLYWNSWLDTTLNRDLPRFFPRGYDPDLAFSLLTKMGRILADGELPSLKHFPFAALKIRSYFSALQEIFLLRKITSHEAGLAKDVWLPMDSGLTAYLMGTSIGEGASLSLARTFLWNEWFCQSNYQGRHLSPVFYKSAQGSPVDAILEGIPFRVVPTATAVTRQLKWEERALLGAMKRLGSKTGYLVAPVDSATPAGKNGIGILPWTAWS